MSDLKDDVLVYLQRAREAVVWKLEGASELDVRRPLTPTGTNLLGLVKHMAGVEAGYFGQTFDRPFPEPLPWIENEAPDNSDMWATAEESRTDIIELYQRVWAHAATTIDALPLEAEGRVPWWTTGRDVVTLHRILVHVATEAHRHAGHADIVRELIDGAAGLREGNDNLPDLGREDWVDYRAKLEAVAQQVGRPSAP